LNTQQILVVDDENLWQELIERNLRDLNYRIFTSSSGQEALNMLHGPNRDFDLVILDKFMDGMDGIEVLRRIKIEPRLKTLPVVLASADTEPEKMLEGIRAGAYYYLTKPFSAQQLQAVVANALNQHRTIRKNSEELSQLKNCLALVNDISLSFRSREQAHNLTALFTVGCQLNLVHQLGLMELLLNAVEHGNLGLSYAEKSELIANDRLEAELNRRLNLPEYRDKTATVKFKRRGRSLIFTIYDQGAGFDWRPYLDMQVERLGDNHGRGIALANKMAFSGLNYHGAGNIVEATIISTV